MHAVLTDLSESLLKDWSNSSIASRASIQQYITSTTIHACMGKN